MPNKKKIQLICMALLYAAAGINHFIHPDLYLQIMPSWLPKPSLLINISGICEIVFAILLLPLITRRFAAWSIIILLIAIFPANIQMAINYYHTHDPHLWIAIARLPLQFILIWWAWSFTKHFNF